MSKRKVRQTCRAGWAAFIVLGLALQATWGWPPVPQTLAKRQSNTWRPTGSSGYLKVTVPSGFSIIGNPLSTGSNTISEVIQNVPHGTTIFEYNPTNQSFSVDAYVAPTGGPGQWTDPTETLAPGEGAIIYNPSPSNLDLSFVGDLPSAGASVTIPAGLSLVGPATPVGGQLDTQLDFPRMDGEVIYQLAADGSGNYNVSVYDFGHWTQAPKLRAGEGFFVWSPVATNWVQNFTPLTAK